MAVNLIEIDAQIHAAEQKLKHASARKTQELSSALTSQISALKKQRMEILEASEKKPRP